MSVSNTALEVQVSGRGDDLVLLHGWGMHSAIWQPVLRQLAGHYRVTLLDLPGHGRNTHVAADTLADVVELLAAAAPAHAIWMGWSLGGLLGQWLALLHPTRVRRLLLVASTPCFVRRDGWAHAMAPELLEQFAQSLGQDYGKTLQRFLALQTRGSANAQQLLREMRRLLLQEPPPTPQALRLGLGLLRDMDLRRRLAAIEAPVSWIFGACDALVPVPVAADIAVAMPGAEIAVMEHAGHVPFVSHANEFMDILAGFLRDK